MPNCWIIAGPNGAGKTTFALDYLPEVENCTNFANADLIAAGLSPLEPHRELFTASRIFLAEINSFIEKNESFGFETTLSGRGYLRLINQLKAQGWHINLIYLALPNVETSILRVEERVLNGGHDIPLKDIKRRFPRSLRNLLLDYSYQVDNCLCLMNAGKMPIRVFEQKHDDRKVEHQAYYEYIVTQAKIEL